MHCKSLGQIGDEVVGVLQADMQAHQRPAVIMLGCGADGIGLCRDGEAFESAPAVADAE